MKINSQDRAWLLRDKYQGIETKAFWSDIKKLEQGEPLDYVIGWRDFLGCRIDLSERTLIPRAETEFWTELVIKKIGQQPVRVLDIFAGSGCVGLAVLKHCPQATVIFVDREENCLRQIRKNLKINKINKSRIKIKKADIFSAKEFSKRSDHSREAFSVSEWLGLGLGSEIEKSSRDKSSFFENSFAKNLGQFDFILANPPYVAQVGRGSKVQASASQYEPASALWSGTDGLDIIRHFLSEAKNHLTPAGEIWLEFGVGQKTKIEKLLRKNGYKHWQFHRDQFGRWRFVIIND